MKQATLPPVKVKVMCVHDRDSVCVKREREREGVYIYGSGDHEVQYYFVYRDEQSLSLLIF